MKFKEFFETFKDMTHLSDDELMKGQKLNTNSKFSQVSGRVFFKSISKIKENDIARKDKAKGLDTLTIYKIQDYNKMKCYLAENNSSGYAIHGDELVSVFSSQQSSGMAIVKSAIKNGAKRLDCFATRINGKIEGQLYSLYKRNGFKIDISKNFGEQNEAYSIQKGISNFVDDKGVVHKNDNRVVIFMKI